MSKTWSDTLTAIRERVTQRKRLTLREGEELVARYLGSEKDRQMVLAKVVDLKIQHELDEERLTRAIEALNATYAMLERVLLLWQVEHQGTVSGGHATVAEAYEHVLREMLHKKEVKE